MALNDKLITPGTGPDAARFDDTTQVVKLEWGGEGEHNPITEKPATDDMVDQLEHALQVLNYTLANIASALPQIDAQRRLRVTLELNNAGNLAINAAQWGGQTAASGAGASGNGAPRVTPANDTIAGSPQLFMLYQSMLAPGMQSFYSNVTS